MQFELRPYQTDAIDAIYQYFKENDGNCLIVLPTATGKSVVIAAFVRGIFEAWSDSRVLMVTHVHELISQNMVTLLRHWPEAPAGIHSAGLKSRDIESPILFCGIQSVHRRAAQIGRCDLVLIDEAHLIPRDKGTMYRRFIANLREVNLDCKVIGFTATPYRLDSGLLHKGKDAVFSDIAYEANIGIMVEQGYLCPLTTKATDALLDVTGVGKRGGEFIASELEAKVDKVGLNEAIAREIVAKGEGRGSWLVFAAGLDHAGHLCDLIASHGIQAECVFGETPPNQRKDILDRLQSGELRCVVNVNVLTTGFDAPGVDLIAMCRPTASTGLYVQMLGRGMRLAEGKESCLVLDFARNVVRHGPVDLIEKRTGGKPSLGGEGEGVAPVKTCPQCQEICFAGCRTCPACGHEWPPPALDLTRKPIPAPVMARDAESQWLAVTNCTYSRWVGRDGKQDTMLVRYTAGLITYREWVCIEHSGYPRDKACQWWSRRAPGQPVPHTISEALMQADSLPCPSAITVQRAGQYLNVVAVKF